MAGWSQLALSLAVEGNLPEAWRTLEEVRAARRRLGGRSPRERGRRALAGRPRDGGTRGERGAPHRPALRARAGAAAARVRGAQAPRRGEAPLASGSPRGELVHEPPGERLFGGQPAPLSASQAVRWRPMRRGRLTVPPAPGTRPSATSGSWKKAPGSATTRRQKAGSSAPAPTQAPCTRASTRSATRASSAAALRVERIACAVAGSGSVPNSSRSPPLQKLGPAPREHDPPEARVLDHERERLAERVAHLRREGVALVGPVQREVQLVALASREHGGLGVFVPLPLATAGAPGRELGAGLERRVGQRLGQQPAPRRRARGCAAAAAPAPAPRAASARTLPRIAASSSSLRTTTSSASASARAPGAMQERAMPTQHGGQLGEPRQARAPCASGGGSAPSSTHRPARRTGASAAPARRDRERAQQLGRESAQTHRAQCRRACPGRQ